MTFLSTRLTPDTTPLYTPLYSLNIITLVRLFIPVKLSHTKREERSRRDPLAFVAHTDLLYLITYD